MKIAENKWLKTGLKAAAITLVVGGLLGAGFGWFVLWQGERFEDLQSLEDYKPKLYTRVYDRRGVLLDIISSEKRIILSYKDIPKHFVHAMIAVEDEYFFDHIGVSPFGILSAVKDNMLTGKMRGASTLTQQLVKIITKDDRLSYSRKLKEQFLAVQLEARLTKEEIFAMYANEVPFGNNQFGIESAAKYYFGKSVGSLTLVECATLAGLPQAPSRFNPYRFPEACKNKRNVVLARMLEEAYIDRETYETAVKQPLELLDRKALKKPLTIGGHFIDKVRTYLFDTYGEEKVRTSGWDVYTTLDYRYQEIAELAVRKGLKEKDKRLKYRPFDCPSVFKGDAADDPDILINYFDPSWHQPLQTGINLRAVVVKVTDDYIVVRIGDKLSRLDVENMRWMAAKNNKTKKYYVSGMAKKFKVGDVPLFFVKDKLEEFVPPPVEELEIPEEEVVAEAEAEPEPELPLEETPEEIALLEEPVEEIDPWTVTEENYFPYFLELDQEPDIEGAFVAVDPSNGHILAMVGGYDYNRSKFNRAEQAQRQVGSAIKPVVFGSALEQGYTLSDILFDEPTNFWDPTQFKFDDKGELEVITKSREEARRLKYGLIPMPKPYLPRNYDRKYLGSTTLRNALAQSKNIVAVKLLNQVGYDNVISYAHRLKVGAGLEPFPSLALGAPEISLLDMALVYGTFARNGVRAEPMFIRRIMNDKGLTIEENKPKKEQVIPEQNAYLVTNALQSVVYGRKGTARKAGIQLKMRHLAGKTGTTNDYTNAWFMGYNHQIVAGSWVGRDLNHTIGPNATGGSTALPIWIEFMKGIKSDLVDEPFPVPEGIITVPIDPVTGKKISPDCVCNDKNLLEVYIKGTEPIEICNKSERDHMGLPWYLQKRTFKRDPETAGILPAYQRINYESQLRANQFLRDLHSGVGTGAGGL
ncbi:MAG: transglycosylase domain-containing protein [Acidobacteriota bacterium]|nr:transglycosylase domain-containing protein [Acidobacteriota bacterium]